MFIYSVKAQKIKFWSALAISTAIISTVIFLTPTSAGDYSYPKEVIPSVMALSPSEFKNVETNDDRVEFLKKFGWEVEVEPREITEVVIPQKFDAIYEKYNMLQIGEGLDLEKYKGKSVKRYTYLVKGYDYDGTVYANLLIYKNRVIGGDLCSARVDGFVHGLTKGNDFLT